MAQMSAAVSLLEQALLSKWTFVWDRGRFWYYQWL